MNVNLAVTVSSERGWLLPQQAQTKSGILFYPNDHKWTYREGESSVSLDFASLVGVTPKLVDSLKLSLLWYAKNRSPSHLVGLFNRFKHMVNTLQNDQGRALAEIKSIDLINYRALLGLSNRWYLGTVAVLLKKWHALGYPGVSSDCIAFLAQIRLTGNEKGSAVLTFDAKKGPFTDLELQAIHSAFNDGFAQDKISLGDYILGWLFMLLGQRPVQYALLKVCDVIEGTAADGTLTYMLRIPRAKQQNSSPRENFKERLLIPQIGVLLIKYAKLIEATYATKLSDPKQAPLFPQVNDSGQPPGFEFHRTAANLGRRLISVLSSLCAISERTGEPMHIVPTRFRRTIGTRAAIEGHGELIIAELLDHNDTQNVGVYVQASPEVIARIDRAIAVAMAPFAQAFAGTFILDEADAVRGDDPRSRIVSPQRTKSFEPVGNCGKHGFCGFAAPIACYTCTNFQAWLDGPHEALLEQLLAERERLQSTTDTRITSINDRTIFAVAQVVNQCREFKEAEATNG